MKKQQKKSYITLIDRDWKGKFWGRSFRSCKFIRRLTDEEAKTLDNIQEVIPLKPIEDEVIWFVDDGRIICLKCGCKKGFYQHKVHKGKRENWYNILKCVDCGARGKQKV